MNWVLQLFVVVLVSLAVTIGSLIGFKLTKSSTVRENAISAHVNGADSSIKVVRANEGALIQVPKKGDKVVIFYDYP